MTNNTHDGTVIHKFAHPNALKKVKGSDDEFVDTHDIKFNGEALKRHNIPEHPKATYYKVCYGGLCAYNDFFEDEIAAWGEGEWVLDVK